MAGTGAKSNKKPSTVPVTKRLQDDAIMGTNDYSIVSKRSVEKLFFPDQPQFLRPFVEKFKRRAPLINKGYWLRMKAIEDTVLKFLNEETEKNKVVVNLGCGYEPLPFKMLWKYGAKCRNVKFVDVDYSQLMRRKLEIIRGNRIFFDLLSSNQYKWETGESGGVMFNDEKYTAIGCDLRDIKYLERVLRNELQLADQSMLFIGEVSVVYMEVQKADDLIAWASTFDDARFCLLEQHLPEGQSHPFAKTMLEHFEKQTPLRGLVAYNSMRDQLRRFTSAGWPSVQMCDLWSLWGDIELAERIKMEAIEPFDEWEELALFSGHYFLLTARTKKPSIHDDYKNTSYVESHKRKEETDRELAPISITSRDNSKGQGLRRFGAMVELGPQALGFHGGLTAVGRHNSCDIYRSSDSADLTSFPPEDVMCHTITSLDDDCAVLVGGRNSPTKGSQKCYVRKRGIWSLSHDLELGRYRHCSTAVKLYDTSCLLTFGGRTSNGEVLKTWSLHDQKHGWQTLRSFGDHSPALFGASMATLDKTSGVLVGGMSAGGTLIPQLWKWRLIPEGESISVHLEQLGRNSSTFTRFGAALVHSRWGLLLIGGIGAHGVMPAAEEILLLDPVSMIGKSVSLSNENPRPLLVGFGAAAIADGDVLLVGGSAVCFSFGAYWNKKSYLLHFCDQSTSSLTWSLMSNGDEKSANKAKSQNSQELDLPPRTLRFTKALDHAKSIERATLGVQTEFGAIMASGQPSVIVGLDIGPCVRLWCSEYLVDRIGPNTPVTIHSSTNPHLDFRSKNFTYDTVPFDHFMQRASSKSHVYLRSLSSLQPTKSPTNLATDFLRLANDFHLPEQLGEIKENEHSSVLRISGNISMWLHYDVMANILFQIKGSKRIVLFPPRDVSYLRFPPGETTSDIHVFTAENGSLNHTHPLVTTLNEGEALFIPPCWPHATSPVNEELSVAVNVFFRSLESGYAAGRDVYGNRDLDAYQNGRRDVARVIRILRKPSAEDRTQETERLVQNLRSGVINVKGRGRREIERILQSVQNLPQDLSQFYRTRLADELHEATRNNISTTDSQVKGMEH